MLYKSSPARQYLMGKEPTRNPPIAAYAILNKSYGRKRVAGAVRKTRRLFGRSRHRNNPLPAIVGSVLGGLGGRFKTPSEKRAANVANQLVSAAVAGNLTAAKAIAERTEFGIAKERAVWRKAFEQIPKEIVALVARYSDQIPGVDHSSPESAAETALSRAFDVRAIQAEAKAAAGARAASSAAAAERREARFTELGAVGLKALASRGSRQPARRRKRRSSSRRISL